MPPKTLLARAARHPSGGDRRRGRQGPPVALLLMCRWAGALGSECEDGQGGSVHCGRGLPRGHSAKAPESRSKHPGRQHPGELQGTLQSMCDWSSQATQVSRIGQIEQRGLGRQHGQRPESPGGQTGEIGLKLFSNLLVARGCRHMGAVERSRTGSTSKHRRQEWGGPDAAHWV